MFSMREAANDTLHPVPVAIHLRSPLLFHHSLAQNDPMRKTLLPLIALILSTTLLRAGAPSAETADKALSTSPRHGEWVDIDLQGSTKLHTWVVYPERKDKAPVVIVIHEIFGMTDWVRAVADQLAAEGFIAVAPDLPSGKGPNGGGTDSFTGDSVRAAIMDLSPDEVAQRLNATRDYA